MFCSKCGKQIADDVKFCPYCGNSVNGAPRSGIDNATEKAKNFFAEIQARASDLKGPEPVDFVKAIKLFFLYSLNFKGRSSRSEYWWGALFNTLLSFVLPMIPVVGGLLSLAMMVPGIAISVRRMHDIGKSGWYLLMGLIPLAGPIILLVYLCTASQTEANQWGPAVQYTNL